MNTKLAGNEFYRYKIETQRFFTLKWFHFEPPSMTQVFDWKESRFTKYNVNGSRVTVNIYFTIHDCISSLFPIHSLFTGQFTRDHAKPLPDADLPGTGGKDL